jgi:tetratricopeptide (TPR) repeat protein
MVRALVFLLVLWAGASAGCGGTDIQKRRIEVLAPTRLAPAEAAHKEAVRTARLRVYATRQYQAQNLRWRESFGEDLDLVNQYLIPAFGLRLEVVEFESWAYDGDDTSLGAMIEALEQVDPARDVDWVIGLASALSSTTDSFHQLGIAHVLGRHLIMRGFEDLDTERELQEVDEPARSRLREARRQHRQATVFLHEWAHTLGGLHVGQADSIMMPGYSRKITGFGAQVEALIQTMLPVRLAPAKERSLAAEAIALRRYIEALPESRWDAQERAQLLAILAEYEAQGAPEQAAEGEEPGAESGAQAPGQVPEEVRDAYARVQALHRGGQHAQARAELDELIAAYPAHLEFRLAACRVHLDEAGPNDAARATCGRVAGIAPAVIDGDLMLVSALIQAKRTADAGAVLAGVRDRIAKLAAPQAGQAAPAAGQAEQAAAAWNRLVAALRSLEAVTWAEQAVAAAPAGVDTAPVLAWTTQLRRRYGLPPDSARRHGIAPEAEAAYLSAVRESLAQVYRGDYTAAERGAREALGRYRNAPGLHGVLCDLELRRKRSDAARGHCQKALAVYDDASWPHYLLGILDLQARKNASGIRHLERSIALDPDLRQAYHALYQAYGRAKDRASQERVGAAYQQRFGQPLPP